MIESRLEFLKTAQNADGGWGYFPGRRSWLEPTVYAMLALRSGREFERGWGLMRSWQLPDGAWRPAEHVQEPHWTTALCVTLHCLHGNYDQACRRGVAWLLETHGAEGSWMARLASRMNARSVEYDRGLTGWPWRPGTSSWIEPTAHTLVALRKAATHDSGNAELSRRVSLGERMILERRCEDGGWNYGNRKVLRVPLPSYPETTALALLGLAGNPRLNLAQPLGLAQSFWANTNSRWAKAWLKLTLRNYGISFPLAASPPTQDLMLAALETIEEI